MINAPDRAVHIVRFAARLAPLAVLLAGACSKSSEPRQSRESSELAKPVEKTADPTAAPAAPAAPAAVHATPPTAATGPAPTAVPCDGPALTKLAKQLDTAGGIGVDRSTAAGKAAIDEAISSINGKRVAFKNCVFTTQGNDEVSFAARKGAPNDITCKMAGGEAGNEAFRNAAMGFDPEKLRLDVSGTVASNGNPNVTRYVLTECTITPHE